MGRTRVKRVDHETFDAPRATGKKGHVINGDVPEVFRKGRGASVKIE